MGAYPESQWPRRILMAFSIAVLSVATGVAVARYPPIYFVGLMGLAIAGAIAWWNRGVFSGILVLLLLQGVPLVNTQLGSSSAQGANALNDLIFVVLALYLAICAFYSAGNKEQDRLAVLAGAWAVCYLAWWFFKTIAGSPGVPVVGAIKYGREFMGFSLFLPLALLALRKLRYLVGFAATLMIGAAIFSIGQIATQITHAQLSWLIHVEKVAEFKGVTRIYAPMNELLVAAFPMSFAAMLLAPKPWRRRAIPFALVTGLANALSFTRAIYVSELVALLVISLIWARGAGWQSRRIRHVRSTFALGAIAIAFTVAIAGGRSSTSANTPSPLQAVVSRAELGVSNLEDQSGTTGYRIHKAGLELQVLGNNWITGLGFLNPANHYVPGLRQGSIRDDDLGSLSIVMTMGLIGLFLAYMPPIAGLIYLLGRRQSFVQYGGAMYLAAALVGSITLGTVSTLSGLLVLGSMLALCLSWTALEQPTRDRGSVTEHGRPLLSRFGQLPVP